MLLFEGQIPKTSLHNDIKPEDRTGSLAQKRDWKVLPRITTHLLHSRTEPFLFYLFYSNNCGLDMAFYWRHITTFTIKDRNLIHEDTPQSPKPMTKSALQSHSSARSASSQPSLTQISVDKWLLASHSAIEDTCVYYHRLNVRSSEGH